LSAGDRILLCSARREATGKHLRKLSLRLSLLGIANQSAVWRIVCGASKGLPLRGVLLPQRFDKTPVQDGKGSKKDSDYGKANRRIVVVVLGLLHQVILNRAHQAGIL